MSILYLTGKFCGKEINTAWCASVSKLVPSGCLADQQITYGPGQTSLGKDDFENFYAAKSDYEALSDYFAKPGAAEVAIIPKLSAFCRDKTWEPLSNFGPFTKEFHYTKADLPALMGKVLSYNTQPLKPLCTTS